MSVRLVIKKSDPRQVLQYHFVETDYGIFSTVTLPSADPRRAVMPVQWRQLSVSRKGIKYVAGRRSSSDAIKKLSAVAVIYWLNLYINSTLHCSYTRYKSQAIAAEHNLWFQLDSEWEKRIAFRFERKFLCYHGTIPDKRAISKLVFIVCLTTNWSAQWNDL